MRKKHSQPQLRLWSKTMNKNNKFQQISRSERIQIYALKKAGLSADLIAEQLARHRSTIYRELSRNH